MDALFDVDEFFDRLPMGDPDVGKYMQVVEEYENIIEELHDALPDRRIRDIVKVFLQLSVIEIKMAYMQGMRAGCVCADRKI